MQYYGTYHCSIGKKAIDADYYTLSEEIKMNDKSPKFKVVIE